VIAIRKGAAPDALVTAGNEHTKELCDAYDANPEQYQSGKQKMEIRRTIYASDDVKAALDACHHGKCCYCEIFIHKPYADQHVEHWRPKASSRQARDEKSTWPGYYWLAYSWDNLLLSCAFCNRNNKRDLFPLENPAARARHHRMTVEDETPAILKPDSGEDPRDHLKFELDEVIGLTPLGESTIEVLRLKSKFQEDRLRHFEIIRHSRSWSIKLMNSVDPDAREYSLLLRGLVQDAARPDQPYSAMVAAYLEANPLPDPANDAGVGAG
jgi:uncharacterized protein (TIGR02646 family)